jgi:Beta-galactosidase trimerisation domain/Beta-galactosidase
VILKKDNLTRREFLERIALTAAALALPATGGESGEFDSSVGNYPVGDLESVPVIRQRAEWKQFIILVWQWQNDVRRDGALYDAAGLRGFHIDRGVGEDEKVRLSLERKFPYYVDHAAGKGILYLQKDVQASITRKPSLQVRPHSLADPKTIDTLKGWLRENVAATKKGFVYAYAFDDEISLGAFNNPVEVDIHPLSVAWYRKWLAQRYGNINNLNASWATAFRSFDEVEPVGFDDARKAATRPPFASWNLSRWMEWRHFMDYQFAQVLADLTRYTNKLDPAIPAGFVGGQQPSAYGGYDYALLSRAVQWMESSDLGGTNEILRSFWNRPRRAQAQTFDARWPHKMNVWTLWHRLAHGNQATIAWPEGWMRDGSLGKRELSPVIEQLAPTFREIQGRAGEFIINPDSYLETDPIGLYYSHPSIRAGWAMDSITHGGTWPKRLTSMDDANLSSAHLRLSWCKLLEDLGYQYDFISYLDVDAGHIDLVKRFKVIILPQTLCLSEREARALRQFVRSGGMLIADTLCGLLSETGRGRKAGILDDLFGIVRDESRGYLNGQTIVEVDAENFQKPFPERLHAYDGALSYRSMIVFERGTKAASGSTGETARTAVVLIRRKVEKGETLYLNLTPLAYAYFPYRAGKVGQAWREVIGKMLGDSGLRPRVEIYSRDEQELWMESLLWRNANRYCLAVLKNVLGSADAPDAMKMIEQEPKEIMIRLTLPVREVRNIRTEKSFGDVSSFNDRFNPWEASLYEFTVGR